MTRLTIKTGTAEDFFKRGRQLAQAADRGEPLPDERIISFEDPADMIAGAGIREYTKWIPGSAPLRSAAPE